MKQTTLQIIFNVLLFIVIITLIVTTVILVKNVNIIKSDPFLYSMSVHNFSSCSCIGEEGMININNKGEVLDSKPKWLLAQQ